MVTFCSCVSSLLSLVCLRVYPSSLCGCVRLCARVVGLSIGACMAADWCSVCCERVWLLGCTWLRVRAVVCLLDCCVCTWLRVRAFVCLLDCCVCGCVCVRLRSCPTALCVAACACGCVLARLLCVWLRVRAVVCLLECCCVWLRVYADARAQQVLRVRGPSERLYPGPKAAKAVAASPAPAPAHAHAHTPAAAAPASVAASVAAEETGEADGGTGGACACWRCARLLSPRCSCVF